MREKTNKKKKEKRNTDNQQIFPFDTFIPSTHYTKTKKKNNLLVIYGGIKRGIVKDDAPTRGHTFHIFIFRFHLNKKEREKTGNDLWRP